MKDKLIKIAKILLKCFLGFALVIVIIISGLYIALSTEWGQQKLYDLTFDALQKTLDTRLAVKEVEADIIRGRIMLHGVELDDKDGVKMLQVDSIGTQLGLGGIFNREIYVNKLYLKGARMVLYKKTPKSAPNYQFVLDAFKKKSKQKKKTPSKPKEEPFFHIAIAIEVDEGVGGDVELLVEGAEFLVAEVGDDVGIAAGFKLVAVVREEVMHDLAA